MTSLYARMIPLSLSVGQRRARIVREGTEMVLDLLATGAPVAGVLSLLTRALSDEFHTPCGLYLLKQNRLRLCAGDLPGLPDVVVDSARPHLWKVPQELVIGSDRHTYDSFPVKSETSPFLGIVLVRRSPSRVRRRRERRAIAATAQLVALAVASRKRENPPDMRLLRHGGSPAAIVYDLQGRISLYNQSALELLGETGSLQGRLVDDSAMTDVLCTELKHSLQPVPSGRQRFQLNLGDRLVEGAVAPLCTPLGRPYGVIVNLSDLTAESRYRRLQDVLIANVSHEIHGPLATLSATIEALHDGILPDAHRRRYVEFMLAEMKRLRRMTDDLMRLSRLDTGAYPLCLRAIDVDRFVSAATTEWAQQCAAKGIRLTCQAAPCSVYADEGALSEVLANLLRNAVEHTPHEGAIQITAHVEGHTVRFSVADTGTGIDSQHLPHIWDRFYRVDGARTRTPGAGIGLGLALVKALVRRMGGEVAVVSTPASGSAFSVTLPCAPR